MWGIKMQGGDSDRRVAPGNVRVKKAEATPQNRDNLSLNSLLL